MAQLEFPSLNEVEPSWADVQIKFPLYGGPVVKTNDIESIKWSDKVDVGVTRGTSGGRKLKTTTGQYDCDGTVTFYKSGWKTMRQALAAVNPRMTLARFDILIQHTPPGSSTIHTVKLMGCRVTGRSSDSKEGTDAEKVECSLSVMRIEEDGASLL